MAKNLFIFLLFLCFYLFLQKDLRAEPHFLESYNVRSCIGDAHVYFRHLKAYELIQMTEKSIKKIEPNLLVIKGLEKYFKLDFHDPKHTALIKKVFSRILKVAHKAHKTDYVCDYKNKSSVCEKNDYGGTKFLGKKVFLCSDYFTKISDVQQIAVILHQWIHAWGGCSVARFKEKSCADRETLNSKTLIKQPDQYMQFIYFVGSNGTELSCF